MYNNYALCSDQQKNKYRQYPSIMNLDLAHFGGHARHIVPPLSPSQPVIADEKMVCSGKECSRSSLLSLLFFPRFFVVSRFSSYENEYYPARFRGGGVAVLTNQAPKSTVSIYVPQAQANSLQSALHRAAEFIR